MAKVKVINNTLDFNLNGVNFNNTASQTIFSFGRFSVTSNFDGRKEIDYSNELSSFVRPVTLETLGLSEVQSEILLSTTVNAVLNLDKSDLNTFVRYGSAYEFLRATIQNIILEYPASLFMNSQTNVGGNLTFYEFSYDSLSNTSRFKIPTGYTVNQFGLIINAGNNAAPDDNELRNLNLSYDKYIVWTSLNSSGNSYNVIGFTGYSSGSQYLTIEVAGNPFPMLFTGNTINGAGSVDFHIKPNNVIFEEFRTRLTDYEKHIVSERESVSGFKFQLKDPTLLDDGTINYTDSTLLWTTSDGYNVDISGAKYRTFLEILLSIGSKYDAIKTDLIARFLTPASLKTYDLTEEGKMTKLLRLYGREFDELRQFIDSLVNINKVTYDKINNVPDQLISNLARTFGWDYFSLVNENEFVETILTIDDTERNLNEDLLPAEIDIELWRRILINTNHYWKSKGTREAIKSMFLLIGIPEPFINITEYVYTVEGKINPNTVQLSLEDFPSSSLPYDTEGYPIAPIETNEFYFQISGDTDSGQAYMDVFRMAGFNLIQTVDNKKSWLQAGAITRIHNTTPQYFQEDSKLVLNTKEVDIALDTSRGIEYDVYNYIQKDFAANSSGYTLPFSFVNISLGYSGTKNAFKLPTKYNVTQGDIEVRYNGILLNGQKMYDGTGSTYFMDVGMQFTGITGDSAYILFTGATGGTDYIVSGDSFIITNENYAINSGNRRDVIQATFIYKDNTVPLTGITVQYVVTRINPSAISAAIPLPSMPRGDVQVTLNGIALTKGTSSFTGDFIVDPSNTTGSSQIIVQNPELVSYLNYLNQISPTGGYVQVAYVEVMGSNDISARNEVLRIDSFSSGKLYFSSSANKFVYKLNYKANNASELKVLIDGIALEPNKDYTVNSQNPYEIFLPKGLNYGTVISVYYLVGGNDLFNPVVADAFGVGDISQLSFLEFIELIQRRLINVRNRKTITDFKGGWYPTLLNVYIQYLKRAELDSENPLLSNGYTFSNLYSFLNKYNAFFQRFVDQLLSATIILKKSGLLIRNTVFTKQKFTYKRGVNLYAKGSTIMDMRGKPMIQYLGDAGSMFVLKQDESPLIFPSVETKLGVAGIYDISNTGGINIVLPETINYYGMQYKKTTDSDWTYDPAPPYTTPLVGNSFNHSIFGLSPNTQYQYRAYVSQDSIVNYYGNIITVTTQEEPPVVMPTAHTCAGTMGVTSISATGGYILPPEFGDDVEWYGMEYRAIGTVGTFDCLCVTPTALTYTAAGGVQNVTICSSPSNAFTIIKTPIAPTVDMNWVLPEAPEPPQPLGISQGVTVTANGGTARSGWLCYSAATNTVCVCVTQAAPTTKTVSLLQLTPPEFDVHACGCFHTSPSITMGECYFATICYNLQKASMGGNVGSAMVCVTCNGSHVYYCVRGGKSFSVNGQFTLPTNICVDHNDVIMVYACVEPFVPTDIISATASIHTITSGVGSFTLNCSCRSIFAGSGVV